MPSNTRNEAAILPYYIKQGAFKGFGGSLENLERIQWMFLVKTTDNKEHV